ncbi:MAG TPA: hypothetical protein VE991_02170, partial [Acidimicrobiales bacterium]|nr:hypothetical protein [Acidimicrobiales bacterium]
MKTRAGVALARRYLACGLALVGGLATGAVGGVGAGAAPAAAGALTFSQTWTTGALPDTGAPIAESSPMVATLDAGGPAAVVADRSGNVFAFHLADGSAVPGWPANDGDIPIDSTPSVLTGPGGTATLYLGLGNAAEPQAGGYLALQANGRPLWFTPVVDPASDNEPAAGVQASLTVAPFGGRPGVVAGSLDQEQDALDAATGGLERGWPFFTADSVFSTASVADLYGIGTPQIVEGGAQTAGFGLGKHYQQGGHVRILTTEGGLVCEALTDQTVDSSPALGPILGSGAPGIVTGTGAFFSGAADSDTVRAYDTHCRLAWSTPVNGFTTSSPAVADVLGTGHFDVVEGTDTGASGSVYVL